MSPVDGVEAVVVDVAAVEAVVSVDGVLAETGVVVAVAEESSAASA